MRVSYGRWPIFGVVFLFTVFSALRALSETENCITHSELNEWHSGEETTPFVCDLVSKAYFDGLGLPSTHDQNEQFEELPIDLHYYLEFRYYLRSRGNKQNELGIEEIAHLLSGVAVLPDSPNYFQNQDNRNNYYTAFAMLQLWEHRNRDLRLTRTTLWAKGNGLVANSQLRNRNELSCFIKFDIPTLPIETILSSSTFEACRLGT